MIKVNLTVRGHDLTGVSSPNELANRAQEVGITNLQFAMGASFPKLNSTAAAINPGMGTYFKNLFAKKNVQIALLSCYSNLIHPDAEKREEILQKFEAYLRHAAFFGASMVASETGSVLPNLGFSELNFEDAIFEDLVRVIQRLVTKGEEYKTLVAIEAGLNHPLYSVERTKQLVAAIPSEYLGIILDPTNLITAKNHYSIVSIVEEAFKSYGEKICAVHLKDYIVEGEKIVPVPLGEGIIPYKEILKIVECHKPYCYVVLEQTKDEGILKAKNLIEAID